MEMFGWQKSFICMLPLVLAMVSAIPQYHHGPASSFAKFHGPVILGNDQVVRVDAAATHEVHQNHPHQPYNQHHQNNELNNVDYMGHPLYDYAYGVTDHKTGDRHGQKERRDGHKVQGEYHVSEPSGNVRTVRYWADETGFHASVHNSDPKAALDAHPPGPARKPHHSEDDGSRDYW
ncbi:uncharacterized protein LOC124160389 [Ischnura elegans]|uniref:uncharacterized protein LOC124160389 n=1 Tax=Ischnura elegans TaxID=197161 RepID=UPI001ED8AD4F|nr:uncharacterized protein LOC124160389 [Ischnura elegans]